MTPIDENGIRGYLHTPEGEPKGSLVLTHGASSNSNTPLLQDVAGAFCNAGWAALRIDLPFRQRRPSGSPGRGDAERDRAGLEEAIEYMRSRHAGPVIVGGHSYGGRQSSMLVSEKPGVASGLLLLSYPLHPPGKADQPRTEHLPRIQTPTLFVHGTRDPFGTIEELQAAIALIPARTELMIIDRAGHDLRSKWDKAELVKFF